MDRLHAYGLSPGIDDVNRRERCRGLGALVSLDQAIDRLLGLAL
jgi:hypothetical protein